MTTSSARIFDIKRFAVHDGLGIRTTIFFKGCPLRCKWCHNPEGLRIQRLPIYFSNRCIHCKLCDASKKDGQMTYTDHPIFHYDYQGDFDHLVSVCPTNAITYDAKEYTLEELMKEIKKDLPFYKYNGGVTFSGGEPFLQHDFLLEILKACKKEGIHTAIESSFYISNEIVRKVIPYVDQIYCDLKLFNSDLHIEYTGVENKLILENIAYLLSDKEIRNKVIIRTPLIPNITATTNNIKSIAEFLYALYPDVTYELLNYNPLAYSKYDLYQDVEYGLKKDIKKYNKEKMNEFYKIVENIGIKNLIKE